MSLSITLCSPVCLRGPLHGIPIGLKDLFDTAGAPTTANSRVLRDRVSLQDATVASRLRVAGTVLLGKLHMNEFAMGTLYLDDDVLPARNPWSLDRMPGGEQSMPEVTFRCNTEVPEQPILPSERRLIVPETPSIGKSIMRGGNHSE